MNKIVVLSGLALGLAGWLAPAVASASDGPQIQVARPGAQAVNADANNQGNPNAVPPILPPVRPSELAGIRRAEAQKAQEFYYRLPASARYSNAEMNVFAAEGYGGS
jgi:hypothetical protein